MGGGGASEGSRRGSIVGGGALSGWELENTLFESKAPGAMIERGSEGR